MRKTTRLNGGEMNIETKRLTIRPWAESDAEDLQGMFGSPEAMRFWNAPPAASVDAIRATIARSLAASEAVHKGFAIVLRQTGRAVGMVNYHHREPANQRLEIGYILDPAHQGCGLAYEAVSAFVSYCFNELESHRVEAFTDPQNTASCKLLKHIGFICEGGPLRERIRLGNGEFGDQMAYALLKTERA